MSVLTSVIIFAYYIINISYIIYLYGRYKICPELLWVALQLMMFFGVTNFIESNVESDNQLIRLYLLGLVTYILFSGFFRAINPPMRILNVSPRLDIKHENHIFTS